MWIVASLRMVTESTQRRQEGLAAPSLLTPCDNFCAGLLVPRLLLHPAHGHRPRLLRQPLPSVVAGWFRRHLHPSGPPPADLRLPRQLNVHERWSAAWDCSWLGGTLHPVLRSSEPARMSWFAPKGRRNGHAARCRWRFVVTVEREGDRAITRCIVIMSQ